MSTLASRAARPPPASHWRWREHEWAWIAALCMLLCSVFSLWPALDLWVADRFYQGGGSFIGEGLQAVQLLYRSVPWIGRAAALLALLVAIGCWHGPRPGWGPGPRWRRRWLAIGLILLTGVGAAVNGALKETWGRPRPEAISPFGGMAQFEPALRPGAQCRTNCSFVSGHAATGFALMAVGMAGAPATRRRWLRIGWLAGCLIGLGRIAQGGHFLSDVLFSGLVIWACCAGVRQLWLMRAASRMKRRQRRPAVSTA